MSLFTRLLTLVAMLCALTPSAWAVCNINGAGMTFNPQTGSTGTFTPPTTPVPQPLVVTISGTYTTDAGAGTCTLALGFQRATLPSTMAISGGGAATLPYRITSASNGGNTIQFAGTSVTLANVVLSSFASAGRNLTNRAFSVNITIFPQMQPGSPQSAGSYLDSLVAFVFNLPNGTSGSSVASFPFTVTGTVAKVCTIGGLAQGPTGNATIPVSAAGAVNTGVINRTFSNVACNTPSNVRVSSQNGAVRTATAPPAGFTNQINYSSTASFGGATANLNTATNPTAAGQETGTAVSTTGATPSGTLTVAITPQANTQRLLAGSYGDVLRITITPQ
ncbi:MAG: hypothetical protein K2Y05_00935 [Hyphomicrobiaceae bacterium]|nr:hypothetical protein [Hyphomicrobiaceae bacterium]